MPPHHRAFIEELQSAPSLRHHVLSSGDQELRYVYNACVAALCDLRTYHIAVVAKYITMAAINAKTKPSQATLPKSPPSCLEGRGTGGSSVMSFLKSVRDSTREAVLSV